MPPHPSGRSAGVRSPHYLQQVVKVNAGRRAINPLTRGQLLTRLVDSARRDLRRFAAGRHNVEMDLNEALAIVLDLAEMGVIDDPDMEDEAERQLSAIEAVRIHMEAQ
jgi:hypothetical protein